MDCSKTSSNELSMHCKYDVAQTLSSVFTASTVIALSYSTRPSQLPSRTGHNNAE
jgi:hypothetical protein